MKLMKILSDVQEHFHNFISWAKSNSSLKVRRVHSDSSGEQHGMKKSLERRRTTLTVSTVYNLQSNILPERIHCTLMEKFRAMLTTVNMAPHY